MVDTNTGKSCGRECRDLAETVTKLGFGKYLKILLSKWNSHAHVSELHTANSVRFRDRAGFEFCSPSFVTA